MRKEDKMKAYEGIDIDKLNGKPRDREITKLYIQGIKNSELAERYGISRCRIGQVTDRMARIARRYRNWMEDPERLSPDRMLQGEDRAWRSDLHKELSPDVETVQGAR